VPPGRAIDVGRDSKRNTLAFHDPTMSVQHLRLALDEGEAFLLDLGSTNGVLHNGRRVHSTRIEPGDRFRAGMIEFELVLHRASAS
jgi:pSer/pThr/pTyr-binding forkhead associated (FHA) protein